MPGQREKQSNNRNRAEFQRMKDEEISLYDFVRAAWHVIEPSKPFVDGKHIEAICKHLEAVFDGWITRIVVNMPPRFAKSSIISVLFRVWTWIRKPWTRFLCASYALSLAIRDNLKCRRLIQSQWFQERYGHIFSLSKSQNAKIKFENSCSGSSHAVSVGSSTTGEGFDVGIIDDPHAIDEKRSDTTREGTLEWFRDTWCTRLNDPMTSVMIIVCQRVHQEDLSGYILSGETGEHWVHLNLPLEYEPNDRCITHLPNGEKFWEDWREMEGDLLWPDRFPADVVARAKRRHGPQGFAALYQQRPIPAGGLVFNQSYERLFAIDRESNLYLLETPRGVKPVPMHECWLATTSDVAAKAKEQNDFTVFSTWAITPDLDVLLLDVRRNHWTIPEQKEQGYKVYREFVAENYNCLYFEDVGYQSAIGQELIALGVPCLPFSPAGKGDKVLRATAASIWQQLGKVYFVKNAHWLPDWRDELYFFPKAPHDDQIDTLSMMCLIVRQRGPLSDTLIDEENPLEPLPEQEQANTTHVAVSPPVVPSATAIGTGSIDPFQFADQFEGGW